MFTSQVEATAAQLQRGQVWSSQAEVEIVAMHAKNPHHQNEGAKWISRIPASTRYCFASTKRLKAFDVVLRPSSLVHRLPQCPQGLQRLNVCQGRAFGTLWQLWWFIPSMDQAFLKLDKAVQIMKESNRNKKIKFVWTFHVLLIVMRSHANLLVWCLHVAIALQSLRFVGSVCVSISRDLRTCGPDLAIPLVQSNFRQSGTCLTLASTKMNTK